MKVAFVGAGSLGFTRRILADILTVKAFSGIEVSFTDINPHNLEMVTQLCQRDIDSNGLKIKINPTTDRRAAFKNANYVVNSIRQGGLEAFATDIDIPLKYGVDQCVGDTLCAGGVMYGQRDIPEVLAFCKDIREVAAPGCIMLNYANPNAMITWACNQYGGVKTIGLCHGVQGGYRRIAQAFGVEQKDLDIICAGINHMTWFVNVKINGRPIGSAEMLAAFEANENIAKEEKVRVDMLRRTGYFSTESNGHLSEYLPYYRKRVDEIEKWICMDRWILGETGGYLRVSTESRNWFETDFPNWMKEPPIAFDEATRSAEHGARIIEGLETGRLYRGHFNVINNGCITNLPDDCCVEAPGYVDFNGVNIPQVGDLPLVCAALCNSNISVQRLAVEAGVRGDVTLLKQAMMMDPLVAAVCDTNEIWQMTDEMLIAQEQWLPQYKDAIAQAKKDWAAAEAAGTLIKTKDTRGAARLETKTVEQLAEEKDKVRKLAQAADKDKA